MEFYESISAVYDYIFPLNEAQAAFVYQFAHAEKSALKLLDVGCASGSLALKLAEEGSQVWALDFDKEMAKLAQKKKDNSGLNDFPVFGQLDMRLIDQQHPSNYFDEVLCFGNTLVHLLNDDDILQFLSAAHSVLHERGKLLMQILNYDFILNQKINLLPLIDNEHIRFERFYDYPDDSALVDFKTKLTVKSSGQHVFNSVRLNPIRKNELEQMLLKSGFHTIEFFGNFKCEPLQSDSLLLIVSAEK